MPNVRALHLHTVDSLCTDLICGLSIGIGTKGETFALEDDAARSILNWYRQNRARWARNVLSPDVDLIVDAALQAPPTLSTTSIAKPNQKRALTLCRVEAHRFGGLHAYSDAGEAPESFVLEIKKPITLLEGWNGSGKTSIANAAVWCLTGQLLRPQRKPEQADAEYECRVDLPNSTEIVEYKLTPVTPLPNGQHFPRTSDQRIPLDTWVELTFIDEEDKAVSRVRRTQSRTARGVVTETLAGLDELGIHPISAQIGTTIPGLLPFIQVGGVSEFGQAIGAHVLVTTHSRDFARLSVEQARRTNAIEHRSVHPVNAHRTAVETAPAIEELDRKRQEFLKTLDDAIKAQDYVVEARSFIEARLSDLFDSPEYPAYSAPSKAPSFSDLINRLRGLMAKPPNEFFRKKIVSDFCNDRALVEGAECLALLNKAHHKDKSSISYKDAKDEDENLRRIRVLIEEVHEEFRRWKWREQVTPAVRPAQLKSIGKLSFCTGIQPDLAAFTGAPSEAPSQDEVADELRGDWFEDKSLFFLRNDNLGFAAPSGSIVIVEVESKLGNDRNLVIARYNGQTLARRLLRPQRSAPAIALAAQTPDPRKSPPTVLADPSEVEVHRIVGVLFDDVPAPASRQEAVAIDQAPVIQSVETAYRVRDDSALPLALPGQIVLGGKRILPNEFDLYQGRLVALTMLDGLSIFKRVGVKLPGSMGFLRQFESIGGLGSSEIVAIEEVDGAPNVPVMTHARLVLGVLYE